MNNFNKPYVVDCPSRALEEKNLINQCISMLLLDGVDLNARMRDEYRIKRYMIQNKTIRYNFSEKNRINQYSYPWGETLREFHYLFYGTKYYDNLVKAIEKLPVDRTKYDFWETET